MTTNSLGSRGARVELAHLLERTDLVALAVDEELGVCARRHRIEVVAIDRHGDADEGPDARVDAPTVRPTHEPNDIPPAHSGAPG